MCHSTENIYRWRDTAVARASGAWVVVVLHGWRSVRRALLKRRGACAVFACLLNAMRVAAHGLACAWLPQNCCTATDLPLFLTLPFHPDDFYPTDRASHIPHLAACAFNGLFLSPLALPGARPPAARPARPQP